MWAVYVRYGKTLNTTNITVHKIALLLNNNICINISHLLFHLADMAQPVLVMQ